MELSSLSTRDVDSIVFSERAIRARMADAVGSRIGPSAQYDERVLRLLNTMFSRTHPDGKPFSPLLPSETVDLVRYLHHGSQAGRWQELHGDLSGAITGDLNQAYAHMRYNFVTGSTKVRPVDFGAACTFVTDAIIKQTLADGLDPRSTAVVYPLRAGLAFYEGALRLDVRHHLMLGIKRDHATATPSCYLEPSDSDLRGLDADSHVVVADPMLATAGSVKMCLEYLLQRGVSAERVTVAAMVAAPEGVARLLHETKVRRIIVGRMDQRLNENAYIIDVGLGDCGDQLEFYLRSRISGWFHDGKLTKEQYQVLDLRLPKAA
jgi:uracil phosphoribosyltransferase